MSNVVSFSLYLKNKAIRMTGMVSPEQRRKLIVITQFMDMDEVAKSLKRMDIDELYNKVVECTVLNED